ncbi:MAG: glycosyltransferase [Candidatus Ancaeobacter aquaticus]|nr:glycosyltransferase [Candidatus Ancaeobacter aquaticus]
MTNKIIEKEIAVVGHVTEVYGPVQALTNYLKKQGKNIIFISNPFAYCSLEKSIACIYKDKMEVKSIDGPKNPTFKKLYALYYIRSSLFTFIQVVKRRKRVGLYIGIDNLNAFIGLILKKLGYVDKVVYYVIDYTKKRFLLGFFNWLYHFIDRICIKNADYIWNISSRIADVRESQGVNMERNLVVPVGVELEKIKKPNDSERDKNLLVAVSHLTESKGIQLIIDVMSDLRNELSAVKLHIIGTGPYESVLIDMVKKMGLDEYIKFLGPMNHDDLFAYLPKCGIALATYTEDPDSITYYADPTKPKEYLACGLPVIITKVPWIAEAIDNKHMGIAIHYKKDDLKNAIIKMLQDSDFYDECRINAFDFASKLSWDQIYDKALDESRI